MTVPLWTADELREATGGEFSYPFDCQGVSIDTRTLVPGDLFIALQGDGRDGHAFVADAKTRGAAGAMVHADLPPAEAALGTGDTPVLRVDDMMSGVLRVDDTMSGVLRVDDTMSGVLRVDDTMSGLTRLGGFARSRFDDGGGRMVAVTGSVGKTTTKEMLRGTLSAFGSTHAAVASYNNHWGVPLTLARMPRDAAFCVTEIGMNQAGEIAPLARLVRPHVAVITSIARAHVGNLGSVEAIADEKASVMRGLEPGGVAVLPADSDQLERLRAEAGDAVVLTFGIASDADVRLVHCEQDTDGTLIHVDVIGQTVSLRINAPGRHMAMNAVATLAVVAVLGLDTADAMDALEAFAPLPGRGARREVAWAGGSVLLVDESYNGNGASVRAALDVLGLQPRHRRVAVLGDMLELGDEAVAEHVALAEVVAGSVDCLFTCGPLMRHLFDAVPANLRGAHARDSAALASVVADAIRCGDVILVKGSLGSGMKHVISAIEAGVAWRRTVTAGGG